MENHKRFTSASKRQGLIKRIANPTYYRERHTDTFKNEGLQRNSNLLLGGSVNLPPIKKSYLNSRQENKNDLYFSRSTRLAEKSTKDEVTMRTDKFQRSSYQLEDEDNGVCVTIEPIQYWLNGNHEPFSSSWPIHKSSLDTKLPRLKTSVQRKENKNGNTISRTKKKESKQTEQKSWKNKKTTTTTKRLQTFHHNDVEICEETEKKCLEWLKEVEKTRMNPSEEMFLPHLVFS